MKRGPAGPQILVKSFVFHRQPPLGKLSISMFLGISVLPFLWDLRQILDLD